MQHLLDFLANCLEDNTFQGSNNECLPKLDHYNLLLDETLDLIKQINTENEYNPLVDFLIPPINEQNGLESTYPDLDLLKILHKFLT